MYFAERHDCNNFLRRIRSFAVIRRLCEAIDLERAFNVRGLDLENLLAPVDKHPPGIAIVVSSLSPFSGRQLFLKYLIWYPGPIRKSGHAIAV